VVAFAVLFVSIAEAFGRAAGELYFHALADDLSRQDRIQKRLAIIRSSATRKEIIACRQAGSNVVAIYFDAIFGPDR